MKKLFPVAVCAVSIVMAACSSTEKHPESSASDTTPQGTSSMPSSSSSTSASSSTGVSSDTTSRAGTASTKPFSRDNFYSEMILNQLHHMNQYEIQLAQLAQDNAQSESIKTLARQITTDHQSMDSQVQQIAKSQDFTLSDFQPASYEKATFDRLRSLSGSQFDQAFGWTLHSGHQEAMQDLRMFRKDAAKNPQLSSLISQAMPKYQKHAEMSHRFSSTQMGGEMGSDQQAGDSSEESAPVSKSE
jgi:putative membrane protein